ncbi:MAG: hypothetical protein CMN37_04930 [SAR116 cluster bacterium]|nr:hypothetical protein [SAR116 cluster bacterium]
MLFRLLVISCFLIGCSLTNNPDSGIYSKLSNIEIEANNTYISDLIKKRVQNNLIIFNNNEFSETKFKLILNIDEDIEGSLLSNSIRKIEISTNFKIINNKSSQVVYEGSFARNSLVAPIDSLFSRDQSERNARKRLGVSIANDIVVRLIEWSQSS